VGERVVVTGPNGSGKSTLLSALLGELPLDAGTQRLGPSVVVGRLDQRRADFSDDRPLIEGFADASGVPVELARSMLAKVGLGPEHVARRPPELSPGERTRAVLAVFALRGVNTLVLDEPTNHLDLPAVEQLEEAVEAFDGTLLLVTHDRRLLERVRSTRRIAVRDGRLER
jgi:ATPase subunit of ABC transporter with duplicated ATPase domains